VLHLGLEEVSGRAWFDDVRVTVVRPPASAAPRRVRGPVYRGHSVPRLRGTMVSPDITPESLRTLGQEWRANVIRWQLVRPTSRMAAQPDYDAWLDGELARLDAALPYCRRYGVSVVVDLHSPPGGAASPGGYAAADADLFSDKGCQAKFVEVWQRIARRYKGVAGIWGYDLANEPVEDSLGEDCDDWHGLAERTARAIRAIDPKRTLIVECAAGGNPDGFDGFEPIDAPNVVYSVHMYLPHAFTHQGVFGPSGPVRYPGVIDGKQWDRAQLETALKPVVDFQRRYHVHIYVGEFSAIRWAPDDSSYRYLKDLIDLFEEHGWDWTYHAFREWDGWSVEHGPDRDDHEPTRVPTTRQLLLRSWFEKNRKGG
jgi:aryl-phospho-beta-D-glucosidase BglC (GH1 family)